RVLWGKAEFGLDDWGRWAAGFMTTPIRRIRSVCWARAASGNVTAAPPTRPMNSRRLIGRLSNREPAAYHTAGAEGAVLRGTENLSGECPLYPQKRTLVERVGMCALCR